MAAPILVTGGTGTLGRLVVRRLLDGGGDVRILSRSRHESGAGVEYLRGDLTTGDGIDAAVTGAATVVHCAGGAKGDDVKARTLVRALHGTGAAHLVYISVVGAERIPVTGAFDRLLFGYYASKRAAEVVVEGSGLPWTTLRATQFHDLVLTVASGTTKLPVVPVMSGFRFQPVDADEVAARLVELALSGPAGLVPDLAGPRVYSMDELVRSYLAATHRRRGLLPVRVPGRAARAIRGGANLAPDGDLGRRTWEEFLAARLGS